MPVTSSDIKLVKSEFVTDENNNGGRQGYTEVVSGTKNNIFPRVTESEKTAGITRYRKVFLYNENTDDDIMYATEFYFELPSTADDHYYLIEGTAIDVQTALTSATTRNSRIGTGQLNTAITASDTSCAILMEDSDYEFLNGGTLHIADKVLTSQTIESTTPTRIPAIGDSVQLVTGTWQKIAETSDITYPKGKYIGSNSVLTEQSGSFNEEFLTIAENLYTDEVIGTGDASTSPTLSTLTNNTNGICGQENRRPVVTATSAGGTMTVSINRDGSCTGDCSAGQLNMATGAWTTPITWTSAVLNATNILCTYRELPYSYSGNVATVSLDTGVQFANSYATTNTYVGCCLTPGDISVGYNSWDDANTAAGTYDESTYPPILFNDGTVDDTFTITFTDATNFTCTGTNEGSLGTGSILTDFSPMNPNTGEPYFTVRSAGWGGTWAAAEYTTFNTTRSSQGVWIEQEVPAATAQATSFLPLRAYSE